MLEIPAKVQALIEQCNPDKLEINPGTNCHVGFVNRKDMQGIWENRLWSCDYFKSGNFKSANSVRKEDIDEVASNAKLIINFMKKSTSEKVLAVSSHIVHFLVFYDPATEDAICIKTSPFLGDQS